MPGKLYRSVLAWAGLLVLTGIVTAAEPALLLADTYRKQVDVTQYLVSEKLDGVRAYWDGKQLISRGGNAFNAPSWFTAALPARKLDGELWLGRGRFEEMSGMARREVPEDGNWKQVKYMLFELPEAEGSFAQRVARMKALALNANVPWLEAVEQFRLPDHKAVMKRLDLVIKAGGEGLMLHRADALYETGRSETLLKVKAWHDAEAKVVAHVAGKGKYRGMLGALKVRAPDGREFSLGTGFSDAQRLNPPAIGSTVTYRYRELTGKGLPRFASFWRVREGL
jgi:DNA ligase-1